MQVQSRVPLHKYYQVNTLLHAAADLSTTEDTLSSQYIAACRCRAKHHCRDLIKSIHCCMQLQSQAPLKIHYQVNTLLNAATEQVTTADTLSRQYIDAWSCRAEHHCRYNIKSIHCCMQVQSKVPLQRHYQVNTLLHAAAETSTTAGKLSSLYITKCSSGDSQNIFWSVHCCMQVESHSSMQWKYPVNSLMHTGAEPSINALKVSSKFIAACKCRSMDQSREIIQ